MVMKFADNIVKVRSPVSFLNCDAYLRHFFEELGEMYIVKY